MFAFKKKKVDTFENRIVYVLGEHAINCEIDYILQRKSMMNKQFDVLNA